MRMSHVAFPFDFYKPLCEQLWELFTLNPRLAFLGSSLEGLAKAVEDIRDAIWVVERLKAVLGRHLSHQGRGDEDAIHDHHLLSSRRNKVKQTENSQSWKSSNMTSSSLSQLLHSSSRHFCDTNYALQTDAKRKLSPSRHYMPSARGIIIKPRTRGYHRQIR